MTLPIAYMAPADWYRAYIQCPDQVLIEALDSFEKQTCRNRCLIGAMRNEAIRLTVPVCKVEHKQLTRDIEISYQTRWQHQHWIALVSVYRNSPFFAYYAEFFEPHFKAPVTHLWDWNNALHQTIMQLLLNSPKPIPGYAYRSTTQWYQNDLNRFFGNEQSIVDLLFEFGPATMDQLMQCNK